MTSSTSAEKRRRAATFPAASGATPMRGVLDVSWDSPFDRMCYLIAAPDLPIKRPARYEAMLEELTAATGCTAEELLAHGNKVRAMLFFAEERLARSGALAELVGKQKLPYRLPPVIPAF